MADNVVIFPGEVAALRAAQLAQRDHRGLRGLASAHLERNLASEPVFKEESRASVTAGSNLSIVIERNALTPRVIED